MSFFLGGTPKKKPQDVYAKAADANTVREDKIPKIGSELRELIRTLAG
jgi:hypothetical protein